MTKKNDLYIIKDNDTGIITASGLTKEVAEQYVREFNEDFGMNTVMENATSAGAIAVNMSGGGTVRNGFTSGAGGAGALGVVTIRP